MDHTGEDTAPIANGNVGPLTQVNNGGSAAVIANNGGPSLNLKLVIGMNNNHGTEAIIVIEDFDAESDDDSGGFGPDPLF